MVAGNGDLFNLEDFNRITHLRYEQDWHALRSANKVCFFDNNAVVTAFFSKVFLGDIANRIESFIDPSKYDLIIALEPTVPWVSDGIRELGNPQIRQQSFAQLLTLYQQYGFPEERILRVNSADYYQRLEICISAVDTLLQK